MNSKLLADLSYLFALEAHEADKRDDDLEGDRLADISNVLRKRAKAAERREGKT